MDSGTILLEIEQELPTEAKMVEPLPADRWLAASCLQKSIRRGDTKAAERAALTLWQHDRRKFWTRLHIIALEDVGVGDTGVLVKVLTATSSSKWRREIGDMQVGLHLTRLLCEAAAKSRISDSVFIQCERAVGYNDLRQRLVQVDDHVLTDYVVDEDKPLVERTIALWLLAGTQKFKSDLMPERRGSVEKAVSAIRTLTTPAPLTEACVSVISMTTWPLSVFIPLIWQEAQKHPCYVRHDDILVMPDVAGLPIYCVDTFTRTGRVCFSQLRQAVPELKTFSIQQIGLGVFYLDGGLVDKELTSPELDAIKRAGELADLASAGLSSNDYQRLRDYLTQNMERLADIRQEQLQQYVNTIQGKPTITPSGANGDVA